MWVCGGLLKALFANMLPGTQRLYALFAWRAAPMCGERQSFPSYKADKQLIKFCGFGVDETCESVRPPSRVVTGAFHMPLVEISGGEIASLCYFKSTAHRRHQVTQLKVSGAAELCPKERKETDSGRSEYAELDGGAERHIAHMHQISTIIINSSRFLSFSGPLPLPRPLSHHFCHPTENDCLCAHSLAMTERTHTKKMRSSRECPKNHMLRFDCFFGCLCPNRTDGERFTRLLCAGGSHFSSPGLHPAATTSCAQTQRMPKIFGMRTSGTNCIRCSRNVCRARTFVLTCSICR